MSDNKTVTLGDDAAHDAPPKFVGLGRSPSAKPSMERWMKVTIVILVVLAVIVVLLNVIVSRIGSVRKAQPVLDGFVDYSGSAEACYPSYQPSSKPSPKVVNAFIDVPVTNWIVRRRDVIVEYPVTNYVIKPRVVVVNYPVTNVVVRPYEVEVEYPVTNAVVRPYEVEVDYPVTNVVVRPYEVVVECPVTNTILHTYGVTVAAPVTNVVGQAPAGGANGLSGAAVNFDSAYAATAVPPRQQVQVPAALVTTVEQPVSVQAPAPAPKPVVRRPMRSMTPYKVVGGDTVGKLAKRFKFRISDFIYCNPGVDMEKIIVGQILQLPGDLDL